jgi:hypothetical protein
VTVRRIGVAIFAAAAAGALGPVRAESADEAPVWAYLAECSAVFAAVAETDSYAGADPAMVDMAAGASERFLARAVTVAGEMGQAAPQADVASIMDYLTPRWRNRIDKLFSVRSNLDWIDYCGRLGREHGVIVP